MRAIGRAKRRVAIDPSLARYKNAFPEKLARANKLLETVELPDGFKKKKKR